MKRAFLILIFLSIILPCCKKVEIVKDLEISLHEITVNHEGAEFEVFVYNADIWEVTKEEDWIDIEKNGNSAFIKIAPNKDRERRQKLIFSNGESSDTLHIIQDEIPIVLEVEKNNVNIDGDGGIVEILYMSNYEVDFNTVNDWIRVIETDSQLKKVAFEIKRNLGAEREGKLKLFSKRNEDIHKEILIFQGKKIDHPSISFAEGNSLIIKSKEKFTLTPVFTDTEPLPLAWTSSEIGIAEVDEYGVVTPLKSGECVISARNVQTGLSASINLSVRLMAQQVVVWMGDQNMSENPVAVRFPGEVMSVRIVTIPDDAYTEDFAIFSSDDKVAFVNGREIVCKASGSTDIRIESAHQNISLVFSLFVIDK
jgi:hypothetical protein